MNYNLELKQIVDFPRCRIYRDFIQTLISDEGIRTNGGSFLFYYIILCSYANYRTSYKRIGHITYTVAPGEWVCTVSELQTWFRCRLKHQVFTILNYLEKQNYISFSQLGKDTVIKFEINEWSKANTVLEYNCPCKKDSGFFFFPIHKVHELISIGKCSEMDIILDLWIHAIYNDQSVQGSDIGAVVYYRNNTGNPLVSYSSLGERWGKSKATVCRLLKKFEDNELISLVSFAGKHGTLIYLSSYLSVMFDVSDVMIDKEEVALAMELPIHIPISETINIEETEETVCVSKIVNDEQITVPENASCVSKSHMKIIVKKVAELLNTQGILCFHCSYTQYILSPLSDCIDTVNQYTLNIICPSRNTLYRFELCIEPRDIFPENQLTKNFIPIPKGGN